MPDIDRLFRERLRERRIAAGLDQKQLAAATGVAQSYISQLETGKSGPPTVDRLYALARACMTSADYLAGLVDTPAPAVATLPARGEEMLRVLSTLPLHRREDLLAVANAFAEQDARRVEGEEELERLLDIIEARIPQEEFEAVMRDLFRAVRSHDKAALDDVIARYGAPEQESSKAAQPE